MIGPGKPIQTFFGDIMSVSFETIPRGANLVGKKEFSTRHAAAHKTKKGIEKKVILKRTMIRSMREPSLLMKKMFYNIYIFI